MAAFLRRQPYSCLCLLLLLAVAFPPAPTMVAAEGECYFVAMHVPHWCRTEFIKALWNNDPREIRPKCCLKLACVPDGTDACFYVLSKFCDVSWYRNFCKYVLPMRAGSNSSKLAPPPGHHH